MWRVHATVTVGYILAARLTLLKRKYVLEICAATEAHLSPVTLLRGMKQ